MDFPYTYHGKVLFYPLDRIFIDVDDYCNILILSALRMAIYIEGVE